ncbi:heterokaryon incompatibility protein-domain-containing protein [Cercophora samala]|uniref:Heterokaryon incompatibility protein-domain-containing protein n=1 Tax=Cercophora samala TaxID=330535 RepID=A0AA39ZJ42_9PEZI|nr:heterokaryon incompatibility protein-domain-containing protein [Cercophora samala]
MRLLHTTELRLHSFNEVGKDVPIYAILSHTWGKEEVTFQDLHCNPDVAGMAGYQKIVSSCRIARKEGYHYIWIDTCCIDKSSSAELSEAINSMYRWYEHSAICFVFLEDVAYPFQLPYHVTKRRVGGEPNPPLQAFEESFSNSRWFTRGWTLQELIAPENLRFLDCNWRPIDRKDGLLSLVSKTTGIYEDVLRIPGRLHVASVAQKMSWASRRETTRSEDMAYCLMGIFDIAMPLLYGEGGTKAFLRLQHEILNSTNDQSIFLWALPPTEVNDKELWGLLAESPSWFSHAGRISQSHYSHEDGSSALSRITNRGLFLQLPGVDLDTKGGARDVLLLPRCDIEPGIPSALIVRKIDGAVNEEYGRIFVEAQLAIESSKIALWGTTTVFDGLAHAVFLTYSGTTIKRRNIYTKNIYVDQRPKPLPWRVQGFWFIKPGVPRIAEGCENRSIGYVFHQPVVTAQGSPMRDFQWKHNGKDHFIIIDINRMYNRIPGAGNEHRRVESLASLEMEVWIKPTRFPTGEADVGAGKILPLRLVLGAELKYQDGISRSPIISPAWSLEVIDRCTPPQPVILPDSRKISLRSVGLEDFVAYADVQREERDLRMWYVVSFGIKQYQVFYPRRGGSLAVCLSATIS